ncbi:cytochrome c oxidase subunit 3 [Aequorivita xiaoshiensis]|uniref:Cytochrome c oxidase subunit 3 n=1 Tax=Aequorivita xiaoshiensis TaxID=2874476 RepID=A0A9X1R005_9FLAO|nr:cytochrome c oxidase subunit 3 [Aequorivita xiaoshiensis]MCG2430685.1 cytochrome c oxidase subunit 3 [Aequorivita xiaoshiensis]
MEATVVKTGTEGKTWGGGNNPLKASYGKMMMWFFILSDSLTFAGFLASYGMSRFKFIDAWPIADEVFTHFPFLHGVEAPMYYVAFMTFILIFSSVTMVLAVDAGQKMQQKKVILYMFLTLLGGFVFLGSQAWEWKTFIKGDYGAVETNGRQILQFLDTDGKRVALADFAAAQTDPRVEHTNESGIWYKSEPEYKTSVSFEQVKEGFLANENLLIRLPNKDENGQHIVLSREESITKLVNDGNLVVEGANLRHNEYGHPLFADFFFFITGFHGFHVSIGVLLNLIVFFNVVIGTYERRGHYEMVEKVGLYWHFVDLVWVFVFTFFYLV